MVFTRDKIAEITLPMKRRIEKTQKRLVGKCKYYFEFTRLIVPKDNVCRLTSQLEIMKENKNRNTGQ